MNSSFWRPPFERCEKGFAVLVEEGSVGETGVGRGGEGLDPRLALHAMGPLDAGDGDEFVCHLRKSPHPSPRRGGWAGAQRQTGGVEADFLTPSVPSGHLPRQRRGCRPWATLALFLVVFGGVFSRSFLGRSRFSSGVFRRCFFSRSFFCRSLFLGRRFGGGLGFVFSRLQLGFLLGLLGEALLRLGAPAWLFAGCCHVPT